MSEMHPSAAGRTVTGLRALLRLPWTKRRTDLACPRCGRRLRCTMPLVGRVRRHRCGWCHRTFTAPARAHCVFCAYGSVPCPPVQAGSGR